MEHTNLLSTSLNNFNNTDELFNYIKDFLSKSGVVSVADVDTTVKEQIGLNHVFTLDFMNQCEQNDLQKRYYIFICPLQQDIDNLINKIQSGMNSIIPYKKVAFGYFNYDSYLKDMAKAIGLELMGYPDILDLNNAISNGERGVPYLTFSTSFSAMLAKNLNAKYKYMSAGMNGMVNSFSNDFNSQVSEIGNAFTDGFNQLKASISGLFSGMKGGVNNNPMGNFNNPQQNTFNQQGNTVSTPCNTESTVVNDNVAHVNLNKPVENESTAPVNLDKTVENEDKEVKVSLQKPE